MKLLLLKKILLIIIGLAISFPILADKADREQPIHIEADKVNVDDVRRVSTFEGKVLLTQGTLRFSADKLVVTEDAAGHQFCVATGHTATFRQKREGVDEYVEGYGERIEYNTANEAVDFYTNARVKRNLDEVRGNHITYSTLTEIFKVTSTPESGRVHATIQPKNKNAAPTR